MRMSMMICLHCGPFPFLGSRVPLRSGVLVIYFVLPFGLPRSLGTDIGISLCIYHAPLSLFPGPSFHCLSLPLEALWYGRSELMPALSGFAPAQSFPLKDEEKKIHW
jgi:hypothetical protein